MKAILFPGQGSQVVGMGSEFFKNFDLVKIDTEGEDINVLKGCEFLILQNKIKLIKIEINNDIKNSNLFEIIKFLHQKNFIILSITKMKFINNKLIFMDAYFCNRNNYNL